MPFLTPEQTAIRDMTAAFVADRVVPHALDWDRAETVPAAVVQEAGRLGLFGIAMPAEHGGAGADFLSCVLATEELAAGDAGFTNMLSATNSYCLKVRDFGTEDQKRRFMRPVASGEALGCMLLSEPQAGSDAANLRTRAIRCDGGWRITGSKVFVTSGQSAGYCCIVAVTDPAAGKRGISSFLTRTDKPGYRVLRHERKLGHRTNETCAVELDELEVEDADMLGRPGEGLRVALQGLDSGRIVVAAQAIGVARAALRSANAYAGEREAFGKRIGEHQAVAFTLAEMATEVEVARAMCHRAARLKQAGVACTKEASMAKLFASQMAERVTSAAIQVHGGYGFIADYRVEKYYRDARVFQIYDGTNEIQKIVIARELAAGR
ncbi:MAG: acyl-CoA dehydrogenase family protein [Hyphomicrobiaceae bacterium]|nr:acyl-CoA dehydrogenase family protein [Hyphomicrobiaceae bacterium]